MPALPALIDLSNLGSLGFIVQGDAANDYAGHSVASAGDVNGDGFDDLIVGAYLGDDGGAQAGEAYVIFGKASGFGTVDLVSLAAADGFKIQGDVTGDRAGFSVASAGDFNGDGYDDLIVGAPFGDNGGANAGEAYVIFGKASGFGTIDLTSLAAADGFVIQGDVADYAANSVASAGDVNGDGYDDLIVGARYGGPGTGEAYVIFGKASGFGTINLTGLAPADGFIIQGDAAGDRAGWSVSSAGDVNGDGYDDLIVGAPYGDDGGIDAGETYVIFGKSGGFGTIDLTGLAAADGFVIQGDVDGDNAGFSVASAGDINGDGYDDLIIGARLGDDGGTDAGEAYVIFGKASGFGTIDLTGLAPADGFIIQGDAAGDRAGWSVSSAGDVNGDGFGDIIVGARLGDDGGIDAGEAYVIFGKASGFGTIDLTGLAPGDGFIIQGDAAGDHAGVSVSSAGDLNGDGFDDIIVGAAQGDNGGSNAGEAYVIFGSAAGQVPFPFDFDLATDISPSSGATISGGYLGSATGVSVASAGDVNGDGFDDVIIGAPTAYYGYGAAYVLFGTATGIPDVDLGTMTPADGFRIGGEDDLTLTGNSVSSAGDVNGDGYDDIIVGAPYAEFGDGLAYVIFGKAGGFTDIDLAALAPEDGFTIFGVYEGYGGAGFDVSSGDVNGDGFSDIIVGAPYAYNASDDYPGAAYVIFGKDGDPTDFDDIDLGALDPADGFAILGDIAYDHTGLSVATGDINGDGFDDMLVGAPGNCGCSGPGGTYYGKVWVIFGKETGLATIDLASLAPADGFVITGVEEYDQTGYSVASAGDINGDGFDEIVIGTPSSYDGGDYLGTAYVIFGKSAGFADIDLAALDPADGFAIHGAAAYDYLGITVSGAGDVNGDGFADIIVGAPEAEYYAGASYVIFGKAGGFTDIDLSALTAAEGFIITGAAEGDLAGSVSSAGDVDGDGFDDLIIGAPGAYVGVYPFSGQAYIIYGRGLSARDDEVAVDEDATLSGDIFADNGSGTDRASRGHTFALTEVNGSAANIDTEIILASGAKLTVHADGTFDYDPNGQFGYLISAADAAATGAVNDTAIDTFTYTITGGETATVSIVVTGVELADDELWGDATDNTITGTPDPDVFNLSQGGDDTISGLGSGDTIYFGAEFTAADSVDGGDGDDALVLEGDYVTTPLVLAATSLVNVERIIVLGGAVFTYDITTNDGNVAAGETLIVDGSGLTSSEELLFDGTAETDGRFILIGGECDDTLIGGGRDDRLFGGRDNNYLDGGVGNGDTVDYRLAPSPVVVHLGAGLATDNGYGDQDLLLNIENVVGTDFNDSLTGNKEINVLDGGLGADTLSGADGSDSYFVDNAGDVVIEISAGGGVDIVRSSVSFTLGANVENLDLTGLGNINATGNGDSNTLTGNAGNNILNGGVGADLMRGGFGDDTYVVDNVGDAINEFLGQGTDTVQSSISYTLGLGLENLTLTGAGAINGTGNIFANILIGNANANILDGKAGADAMNGGLGNDTYIVDNVLDTVTESSVVGGTDIVQSSATFTLGSNVENLTLTGANAVNGTGNASVNTLIGNAAANVLDGKGGADTMTGGLGNDTYVFDNVGDVAIEAAGGGTDTIQTSATYTLASEFENLTLLGTGNVTGTGNTASNVLTGNGGANTLDGLGGADTMAGGGGNDTFIVDNGLDQVIELAGGGTADTVRSSISYTLAAQIENLILTGALAINGTGNGLANTLTGNDFNNILSGGLGADTLKGGLGDDTYVVDNVGDVVSDLAGQGTDTVLSSVSYTLGAATENLNLTGANAIDATGNLFANTLNGNGGANTINGGGGADTMNGGLGNDTYVVDNVGDVVLETSILGGTDQVESTVTFTLGSNIEDLFLFGASAISGTGNGQANTVIGNDVANVLNGLAGDDYLQGEDGHDQLHGGLGNDVLQGGAGNDGFYFENALIATNVDVILDFSAIGDTIYLDDAVFTGLAAGALAAGAFRAGDTALDADDRILYDSATGQIFYDSDGSGGASAILVAVSTSGSPITNLDFFVY